MSSAVPLEVALTPTDLALLHRLGADAQRAGTTLWLVGGSVRDALLGVPVLDIDLASEMTAEDLLHAIGLKATSRSQFSTCKVAAGGRTIDLATARSERYARPGALPSVSLGTMASDLARRDFTINAMAVSLAPGDFGALLDPFDGAADLRTGIVRGLHSATFQDDATRALRAVRYAARLGFRIHPTTRRWLRADVHHLDGISPARVHRELRRTVEEWDGGRALLLAHRLGVLHSIHAALGSEDIAARLQRARHAGASADALLGVLLSEVDPAVARERLALTRFESGIVAHIHRLQRDDRLVMPLLLPSRCADVVDGAPDSAVEAVACIRSAEARRNIRRYLRGHERRPYLRGADLAAMGVPPGRTLGAVLGMLRSAVADGRLKTRRGERAFVRQASREEFAA